MKQTVRRIGSNRWFIAAMGMVVGILLILGIRFATYRPVEGPHYHANFAVYINGRREAFKDLKYYEETAAAVCTANPNEVEGTPMSRVHMHGMVSDVVHVEDELVTWGNFFTVLDWNVAKDYIATGDNLYQTNDQHRLTFILNGKVVDSIANRVIGDQDKLLINYGKQSTKELGDEYSRIQNKAKAADNSADPAGCGSHSDESGMMARLQHLF